MQALEQAFGKASAAISEQVQCCLEQLSTLGTSADASASEQADEHPKPPSMASYALHDLQRETGSAGSGQLLGLTTESSSKLPSMTSHALHDLQRETGSAGSGQLLGLTTVQSDASAETDRQSAQQPDSATSAASLAMRSSTGIAPHRIRSVLKLLVLSSEVQQSAACSVCVC